MKRLIALLFLAFAMLPAAHARTQCKPAGMEYIHAFEQRPNWGVYWWCDYKTYDYTVIIPEDITQQSVEQFWGWVTGVNPTWTDGSQKREKDDPLMKALSDAAFAFASADRNRPPAPPAEIWVVAPNGKYPDRPTYPMGFDDVRGTKSDGRAKIGATCDCRSPHVEGKTTYCPLWAPTGATGLAGIAAPPTTTPPTPGVPPKVPPITTKPPSVAVCTRAQ